MEIDELINATFTVGDNDAFNWMIGCVVLLLISPLMVDAYDDGGCKEDDDDGTTILPRLRILGYDGTNAIQQSREEELSNTTLIAADNRYTQFLIIKLLMFIITVNMPWT